jgi:hypothetical protein
MRQFVPLTDEMLYQMGGLPGPLVPYRAGLACWHALVEDSARPAATKIEAAADDAKVARGAQVTAPGSYTSVASASP